MIREEKRKKIGGEKKWGKQYVAKKNVCNIIIFEFKVGNNKKRDKFTNEVGSHMALGYPIIFIGKPHINDVATKTRKKLNLMILLKMKVYYHSLAIICRSFVQHTMECKCKVEHMTQTW